MVDFRKELKNALLLLSRFLNSSAKEINKLSEKIEEMDSEPTKSKKKKKRKP